jgi:hypothetical protein
MSSTFNSEIDPGQPMVYQIRIKGHLGREWTDWFEGLTITLESNGETLLTGLVVDQAALHTRIACFPRGFWPFVQGTSLLLDSEIIPSPIYTQVAM